MTGARFSVAPASVAVAAGSQRTVVVRFAPDAVGVYSGTLTVGTAAVVGLRGSGRGAGGEGAATVSPAGLTFGDVQVGQFRELSVNVTNSGPVVVTLSVSSDNPRFSAPPSISLQPGSTQGLAVRFTPGALGPQSGNLFVGVLRVALSGSGVAPPVTGNPVPTVTSLSPQTIVAGSGALTLRVAGTNFTPAAFVQWNGSVRETRFVSPSALDASILPSDTSVTGIVEVTVVNPPPGGGTSAVARLTVEAAKPLALISQLATAGCPDLKAYVSVVDSQGVAFERLRAGSFSCAVDGRATPCQASEPETPLSVMLVISLQGTAGEEQEAIKGAARAIGNQLRQQDRMGVLFVDRGINPLADFTTDRTRVNEVISSLRATPEGNALYDAINAVPTLFGQEVGRRHVAVVLTAQGNAGGSVSEQAAFSRAVQANIPYFSIGAGAGAPRALLQRLASDTQAVSFVESFGGLIPRVGPLARIFTSQWEVFLLAPNDIQTRTLAVTVNTGTDTVTATRAFSCR